MNIPIFSTQTNCDNASLIMNSEQRLLLDTTKSSETRHHNFVSTQYIEVKPNGKIKISFHLKPLKLLTPKSQFSLVFNFLDNENNKCIERKNILFHANTDDYYEVYFQTQENEKPVTLGIYINKSMKFKIRIDDFSILSNTKTISYSKKEIYDLLENNPVIYINKLSEVWLEDDAIDIIKKLWAERKKPIVNLFLHYTHLRGSLKVKLWTRIFIDVHSGNIPPRKMFTFIFKNLHLFNGSKHQKGIEQNILNLLIKTNNLLYLEESFKKFKILTFDNIHLFYKLGILRLALKISIKDYNRLLSKFSLDNKLERLKLYELEFKAENTARLNQLELLTLLEDALTSNDIMPEFNAFISQPIRKILTRKNNKILNFLDCRTSKEELSIIYELIETAIVEKKPFLFLRLGDGESYMLNATSTPLSIFESESLEYAFWAQRLSIEKRRALAKSCLSALNTANIVGIPSVHRFIRDIHPQTKSLDHLWKLKKLISFLSHNLKSQIIVEDRIHHFLFDIDTIKKIMALSEKTIFISSIKGDILKQVFDDISTRMEFIQTPAEAHMLTHIDYENTNNTILPDVCDAINTQLSHTVSPGTLVLVGAGFAGKQFLEIAKSYGAVALDVGCMVDYYIGVKTRSIVELV